MDILELYMDRQRPNDLYNIRTGITNEQEFQIHPHYRLNFQHVRAQCAKRRTRQIAWLDKSHVWIELL